MTTSDPTNYFKNVPIQTIFGASESAFGNNITRDLIFNKKWFCLELCWDRWGIGPTEQLDLFASFTDIELQQLRENPRVYFLLSLLWEGFSYTYYNFYQLVTLAGQKYNIPPEKLFFISSNLLEEQVYDKWQILNQPDYRINVVSFNFFSWMAKSLVKPTTIDQTIEDIRNNPKFFLCLNRRIKSDRVYAIYKIFKSRIRNNTLLSYGKVNPDDGHYVFENGKWTGLKTPRFNAKYFKELCDSSPCVLDFSDFETNWATHPPEAAAPTGLYKNSMISLVNESLYTSCGNTSLLYSEKSFKPMLYNHPMMIFGQPGANTQLETIGFKTYKNYFDLSFDTEQNTDKRIDLQILQIEKINDQLLSMSVEQRIDWILQDRETIEYNKQVLADQEFNKNKLQKFISCVN